MSEPAAPRGPLAGFRIVEFVGIGPGPFAAMLFADLGANVIRLDRLTPSGLGVDVPVRFGLLARSRPSVALDLKHADGVALASDLIGKADALIEGFRPGIMERLGLGPELMLARNPRLVYGRMTGWGQSGPLAQAAGHDLNYLALIGALHAVGRAGSKPTPPLNLVADFGGGALYLAFGMACAMLEAQRSGKGQVVDAAMTEGAASLMTMFYGLYAAGLHKLERGTNLLDSGSAIYETYECADSRFISIAPIEPKFREVLFARLGLSYTVDDGMELRAKLEKLFKSRTRDEWCALLEGTDACFAPVLSMAEAPRHPHNVARGSFIEVDGVMQPAPAPRFSRTPSARPTPPQEVGTSTRSALAEWGVATARIEALLAAGVLKEPLSESV
ncbi:MAG TPA: CaiB/BaiF CoA-transferase family protein [Xanthobacteraceae bacterium]|nr:CaiB/BaiF CoA-transferase family protein [Xanthobacteraceae bacterium]